MLLWKRYVNNKMAAMRFLHLQQYSHGLNLLYVFFLLDFCLTVHHQLGKIIQINQLDATMIY